MKASPDDYHDWHALPAAAVMTVLASSPDGLAPAEVAARLATTGPNCLPTPKRHSVWHRFLVQFQNLLIYVLLGATLVTAAIGEWEDALVILGVVVINAVVGFIQENKAEAALEAIRSLLSLKATVVRAGRRATVAAEALVPGDIVFLQAGDRVPADLRLVEVASLRCDEASLTGESMPVEKQAEP